MVNISISLDEELVEWLDQLIVDGIISSRSEAVRCSLFAYIKLQLAITDREQLRTFIKSKLLDNIKSGSQIIQEIRGEE